MSIYNPIFQGTYRVLESAVRTATQTIVGQTLIDPNYGNAKFATGINPETGGLIAYLNVTAAPGVETLQLSLEEQDSISGVWSVVCATLVTTATGLVKLKLKQAIAAAAATTTLVQAQDTLPPIWRVRVIHSGGGNWTYSLSIVLYA